MSDPVAICNVGLGLIGANQIETLDSDKASSTEEELCSAAFEILVKKALEERAWLFATGSVELTGPADPPDGEVNRPDLPNRFKLPGDTVAVRAVDDGSGQFQVAWERNGESIMVGNTSSGMAPTKLVAIVTRYVDDPKRWSPTFGMALSYKIASICAVPLTHNAKLAALYEKMYEDEIKKAGTFDAMQGTTIQRLRVSSTSLAGRR